MCEGFAPSACQEVISCETQRVKDNNKIKVLLNEPLFGSVESEQMEIVIKKKSFFFLTTVNNFSKERQIKALHLEAIRRFGLTQIGVEWELLPPSPFSTEGSYCGRDGELMELHC